jgi:hypothetical protein
MKKILLIVVLMFIYSCSLYKQRKQNNNNDDNLSEIEKTIVNDFLDEELKKERYKSYKDFKIVLIVEALKTMKSIDTYLYSLDEWNTMNKINKSEDVKNMYFLDTIQTNTIKSKILNEEIYQWKESDFNNLKMSLLKYNHFREKINSKKTMFEKEGFVIFLSKPLIIDNNNALISFDFLNCNYLCNGINHSTILMRKVNNKWVENGYYEDGVFN